MKHLIDTFELSNGVQIPCIGFGTWQIPDGEAAVTSVKTSIAEGYRHIDTALIYGNEKGVGHGIRESGVARDKIFLTTKHWITERGYEKTIRTAEESLRNLGVDYVDLYLIHWPCVEKISPDWEAVNESTWRGFERLYRDGKVRAIGVSNFQPRHLEALNRVAEIKPMVNQIEFHPGYTQSECVEYCRKNGILVEAWSPLGSGALLKNETLAQIAAKYRKSVAQLCIHYALQKNVLPLPKSVTPERIAANAQVFDFEISDNDLARIDALEPTGYSGFYPEDAPADEP